MSNEPPIVVRATMRRVDGEVPRSGGRVARSTSLDVTHLPHLAVAVGFAVEG